MTVLSLLAFKPPFFQVAQPPALAAPLPSAAPAPLFPFQNSELSSFHPHCGAHLGPSDL